MLPINHALMPQVKPNVAEAFGVTILLASIYLIKVQLKWHGKPIQSGFLHAFLAKGGTKMGYYLEKYLKLVISNAVLIGTICILIYSQMLEIEGAIPIYFTWIFASPFMVLAFNNSYILLREEGTYKDNQKRVSSIGTSIVALAFVGAGTVAFSQGNQNAFLTLTYCFSGFTPLVLFQSVVFGLLYDLRQVLGN